jgi:hypothetical protein
MKLELGGFSGPVQAFVFPRLRHNRGTLAR